MEIRFFYRPLRIMLRDFDPSVRQYPDEVLADGVRTVVSLGHVKPYALTVDELGITPEFATPNPFALVTYHTAKLFVQSQPNGYAYHTRAYAERFGDLNRFLSTLEAEIHKLKSGTAFSGWQSYYAWLHGMAGLPLGEVLAQFDVQAPLWKATFTRDGMRVA
jgi:hypothetical protein